MKDDNLLKEVEKAVYGSRAAAYGSPLKNWEQTAKLFSAILGIEVTWQQALQMMIAVKLARICNTPNHRDSWVDIAGYAAVWEKAINGDEKL